ncbi:hypothetical protein TGPRC2_273280 [Toxoplasma gondii TgCatPRC2]|uniref:Uncharacterized protein n=2 Tax=Toxoplasma gondii TaxID=5811 RepID=V4ZVH4_TOXGV|nr:hypothetical protein TGVEG_273280 [Toxoplasma gondii VEG]KYK71325.1 hypothetical protein TGPRC2_273280 [Toxoplasma gondii TgCatPRC2]
MKDMEATKATDECGGKSPSRKKKREEDEAHGGREANEDEDFTAFALEAPRWNVMLQDALETYFTKGVPVPSAASTLKESQEITRNSFVHRQFIRDRDGVLYKIEATAVLPSSPSSSASSSPSSSASSSPSSSASSSFSSLSSSSASSSMVCRVCREAAVSESTASVNSSSPSQPAPASDEATGHPVKKRCLAGGWRDRTSEYVEPSQVLLYVSYRHFQHVWSAGASEVVLHFLTGKELAECRVMALDRAACRYDLLIEIASLPQAPSLRSELAFQLSRLRWRLQCGPLQQFFRSDALRRAAPSHRRSRRVGEGKRRSQQYVKKVILREGETIYLCSTRASSAPAQSVAQEEGSDSPSLTESTVLAEDNRRLINVVFCWQVDELSACDAYVARCCVEDVAASLRESLAAVASETGASSLQVSVSSQLPPLAAEYETTRQCRRQSQVSTSRSSPPCSSYPDSSVSSPPPICLCLSFDATAAFAPSLPSMTRCMRALTLSEILISVYPFVVQNLVRAEKMMFKRITREVMSLLF